LLSDAIFSCTCGLREIQFNKTTKGIIIATTIIIEYAKQATYNAISSHCPMTDPQPNPEQQSQNS